MSNIAGKAYAMNVVTPVPPGLTWVQRLIFLVARAFPSTLGHLLSLSLIHFARWVIIRRKDWPPGDRGPQDLKNDYVLFCSNFNGTWDQYIDAFSDGNPQGLDLFWYASFKYPQSIPITPFKSYIGHNQIHTGYYYNATPGSGQRDIKAALRVFSALKSLAADYPGLDAAGFRKSYNRALSRVQNNLGSRGYAPIASLDTEDADRHRADYLRRSISGGAMAQAMQPAVTSAGKPRRWTTTFDGGHCFVTALLPVRTDMRGETDLTSFSQRVRDALAVLPTAHQSPATDKPDFPNSPFATSTRTHFARFVVIDDMIFNGRAPTFVLDPADRLDANPVDQLNCPYLFLGMDIDAKDETELRAYLHAMWREMRETLRPVFTNCVGYDLAAASPEAFADYVVDRMIETTMPFNDYWTDAPKLASASLWLVGLVALLVGAATAFAMWQGIGWINPGLPGAVRAFWAFLPAVAAAIYGAYRLVAAQGLKPFAAAPDSDLVSILKALYLQRRFTTFVVDHNGAPAQKLYEDFGKFLAAVQVNNLVNPTQAAGEMGMEPFA